MSETVMFAISCSFILFALGLFLPDLVLTLLGLLGLCFVLALSAAE